MTRNKGSPHSFTRILTAVLFGAGSLYGPIFAQPTTISGPAYNSITARVRANQNSFYVYRDADSGFNHGFPSGFIPTGDNIQVNTTCIDAPTSTGCASAPNSLDTVRGTVLSVTLTPPPFGFSGLNIQEPQNYSGGVANGYDVRPGATISFSARSPNGGRFVFGVANCVTPDSVFIPSTWISMVLDLTTLVMPRDTSIPCQPILGNLNILFAVQAIAPNQGTILLDDIMLSPVPARQASSPSFPLSTQTFGVQALQGPDLLNRPKFPFPTDQVNRNGTSIYESSLALLSLLARGQVQDLAAARALADTFHAALYSDNHGDPVPISLTNSQGCFGGSIAPQCGLHDSYESGDLLLNSDQAPGQGQKGDVRLSGFSAAFCPTLFCLVNDGASGGNNAYAMLALIGAFQKFNDNRYLNDAITIGTWIVANFQDTSSGGLGGYFTGYSPKGTPKVLSHGKSVENNADIFAAFSALASVENQLGNSSAAAKWSSAAKVAGDFAFLMYDSTVGTFDAGTLPRDQMADWQSMGPAEGVCPDPNGLIHPTGNDIRNVCRFLDSDTFTTLALAGTSQYGSRIDWRIPVQHALSTFVQSSITVGNLTFQGFNLVATPSDGVNGIAWEFTGQMVAAMKYVDQLYGQTTFESTVAFYLQQIQKAQTSAPFSDGQGLVASTLQDGLNLPPLGQCLGTPFQCIPERVGLAATAWGIFAEQGINPEAVGVGQLTNKNSASFVLGTLAPDMIAFGEAPGIAPTLIVAPPGPWPISLSGVNLDIIDSQGQTRPAPIYFVTTSALSYLIPAATALGQANLKLTTSTGSIISGTLNIDRTSPGLYTANASGSGVAAGFWIRAAANGAQTQDYLFDPSQAVGSRTPLPVDLGASTDQVYLSLYGTGFRGASVATATVGGVSVPVSGFAAVGIYQGEDVVNVGPLPRSLAGQGVVNIVVNFDGKPANTVTASIR